MNVQVNDIVRVKGHDGQPGIIDRLMPVQDRVVVTVLTAQNARELHTSTLCVPAGDATLHTRDDAMVRDITARYRYTEAYRVGMSRLMDAYVWATR